MRPVYDRSAQNIKKGKDKLMSDVRKCPKCGGEMEKAELLPPSTLGRFWKPRTILPYVCGKCGYIELYEEAKTRG